MNKIEITPELLVELKDKAEKATPGPWICYGFTGNNGSALRTVSRENFEKICELPNLVNTPANAAYIAAANPQLVLALVEEIGRLKEDFDTAARGAAEESVKAVRLEWEANWLASRLHAICKHEVPDVCAMLDIKKCPFFPGGEVGTTDDCLKCKTEPVSWRKAAQDALEAEDEAMEAEGEAKCR